MRRGTVHGYRSWVVRLEWQHLLMYAFRVFAQAAGKRLIQQEGLTIAIISLMPFCDVVRLHVGRTHSGRAFQALSEGHVGAFRGARGINLRSDYAAA